jgi:hypothetical protein
MEPCLGSGGTGRGVWLKSAARGGPSPPGHCYDTFTTHQTAVFLAIYD